MDKFGIGIDQMQLSEIRTDKMELTPCLVQAYKPKVEEWHRPLSLIKTSDL